MKGMEDKWLLSRLDALDSDGKDGTCALSTLARRQSIGRLAQDMRCHARKLVR